VSGGSSGASPAVQCSLAAGGVPEAETAVSEKPRPAKIMLPPEEPPVGRVRTAAERLITSLWVVALWAAGFVFVCWAVRLAFGRGEAYSFARVLLPIYAFLCSWSVVGVWKVERW
jgi:hypothetical protein